MEPFKFGCIVDDEHYCVRPQLEKEVKRHISGGQNLVIQDGCGVGFDCGR